VERRLGVILLNRSKRPLELTHAGRIYSDFCRDVLRREVDAAMRKPTRHPLWPVRESACDCGM
jgi:DNA-binding transcriptional LysR family regulator